MKNKKPVIVIAILVAIIAVFLLLEGMNKTTNKKSVGMSDDKASLLQVQENDWVTGNPNAKITVIEYLDFECEACGAYYPITTQIKEEYKDSIRFVVRYFPLPGHQNSKTSAYAVEAAGRQGKFWEMYDVVFSKQAEWGEQQSPNQVQFEKYALEAGLDIEQWKKDVTSSDVKMRVNNSYKEAVELDLQGTPSFFLNGNRIENPKGGYEGFKKVIDDVLKPQ